MKRFLLLLLALKWRGVIAIWHWFIFMIFDYHTELICVGRYLSVGLMHLSLFLLQNWLLKYTAQCFHTFTWSFKAVFACTCCQTLTSLSLMSFYGDGFTDSWIVSGAIISKIDVYRTFNWLLWWLRSIRIKSFVSRRRSLSFLTFRDLAVRFVHLVSCYLLLFYFKLTDQSFNLKLGRGRLLLLIFNH